METAAGAIFEQGNRSIKVPVPVYIRADASVVGTKEGQGPFGDSFDMVGMDDKFGCNTWEEAESTLQKEALSLAIGKSGLKIRRSNIFLRGICWGSPSPAASDSAPSGSL